MNSAKEAIEDLQADLANFVAEQPHRSVSFHCSLSTVLRLT